MEVQEVEGAGKAPTKISLKALNVVDRLVEFLKTFEEAPGKYKYREKIASMSVEKKISITIDFSDLLSFDTELANLLIENSEEVLAAASEAVKEVLKSEDPQYAEQVKRVFARIRGLPEDMHVPLRKIRAVHLNKLVSLEGIVTRISPVKQRLLTAVFRCKICGEEIPIPQTGNKIEKPLECPRCAAEGRKRGDFELLLEKSEFMDWQKFVLQEKPEELPAGQLPRSIEVILTDDLVDSVRPGDRATVIGILKVVEDKYMRGRAPLFRAILEANNVEVSSKESVEIEISPEDIKKIMELSRRPDIHELITNSIAPSIYGYKEIKRAIAALLFGGVPKVYPDGVRVRGDIHILLIGDPGTAKSQILRYVANIAPRAIYTTGKGSTAAGLTAAVVREKASGDFYLEAGALVLADGGVACIDEFDKMDPRDRVSIHEAMEQQTISIAKAGIVATLNARASVLAAANPAFGRYLVTRTLAENIDLPVTILSRFDLIFRIVDIPNREKDRQLAEYVLDFHRNAVHEIFENIIPPDLLKKYIAFARREIRPRLSDEAKKKIVDFYVKMRSRSEDPESPISITPRQLEALIRLAEANARMALREIVTEEDAQAAIDLMNYFLQSVGIDMETKRIDIDVIMTGQSKSQREKILTILDIVDTMVEEAGGKAVPKEAVIQKAVEMGIDEHFARRVIDRLIDNGELMQPSPGHIKRA